MRQCMHMNPRAIQFNITLVKRYVTMLNQHEAKGMAGAEALIFQICSCNQGTTEEGQTMSTPQGTHLL